MYLTRAGLLYVDGFLSHANNHGVCSKRVEQTSLNFLLGAYWIVDVHVYYTSEVVSVNVMNSDLVVRLLLLGFAIHTGKFLYPLFCLQQ